MLHHSISELNNQQDLDNHRQQHNNQANQLATVKNSRRSSSEGNLKKLLIYLTTITVIALTLFNVFLLYWVVVSLQERTSMGQHSDSYIKFMQDGLRFYGQSLFGEDIVASKISSKKWMNSVSNSNDERTSQTMTNSDEIQFNSNANLSFVCSSASGASRPSEAKMTLTSDGVIELGKGLRQLSIFSSPGASVSLNSSGWLQVFADKLIVNHKNGLDANGHSVQTGHLLGVRDKPFILHSPLKKINLFSPRNLLIESLTNGSLFEIEASEQVFIRSKRGSVIFNGPLIDVTNLRTISPNQSGKTYPNLYKLCHCFLSSTSSSSSSSESPANRMHNSNETNSKEEPSNKQMDSSSHHLSGLHHPKQGLLFGVRPSLNCSSFTWFCNSATT